MALKPLVVFLSQLERGSVELTGELSPADLELPMDDELLHLNHPLQYNLDVEIVGEGILAKGSVRIAIDCDCARCLKPFVYALEFEDWACHLSLEGEDKVIVDGDAVDLTPQLREDIVLALPQHPLCDSNCNGLPGAVKKDEGKPSVAQSKGEKSTSIWDQLDKLKLS